MSYCRFSSDDFSCDVYVYDDVSGGTTVHVAGNRIVGKIPKADYLFDAGKIKKYLRALEKQRAWMDTAKREDIDSPHAGEMFTYETHEETAQFLEELRGLGYNVPQYAIDALREKEL